MKKYHPLLLNCVAKLAVIFEINNTFAGKFENIFLMKEIIGIGNALVDALYQIDNEEVFDEFGLKKGAMHLIDENIFKAVCTRMDGHKRECTTGGSACNTILALAHLNAPVGIIGKIHDDENGRFFEDNFKNAGVRTFLMRDEQPTGTASTFITPDGQRTFGTYLGAAALLQASEILPAWLDGYTYLYIEGYLVQSHELIESLVDAAREKGVMVCIDLASYNIVEADRDFFAHLLKKTDIVFANEEEARAFTGKGPEESLDELSGICDIAVVKVGKRGAYARHNGETVFVPADERTIVKDTTAAGDYFSAGFLYGLANGYSLEKCLSIGTILSNEIIQVIGTRLSEQTWNNIKKLIG